MITFYCDYKVRKQSETQQICGEECKLVDGKAVCPVHGDLSLLLTPDKKAYKKAFD